MAADDFRTYRNAMRGLRGAGETSRTAFYGGVLRHRLLARRSIWIGSRTIIEGAERITVSPGGALRVGLGSFGLTSAEDASVIRIRPGASFACEGVVSLQRGIRVVVDGGRLQIGSGTSINGLGTRILCKESVTIGAGCSISWDVQILDNDFHTLTVKAVAQPATAPVVVGDHVWIGTRAVVLKGVTLGDGSVIAAGAIVTRDVPPGTIAAGIPARVVGETDGWV